MKKTEKIQIGAAFSVIIVGFLIFMWKSIGVEILPWTRTWFPNQQKFHEVLTDNRCMGEKYFIQELPTDSGKTEYYWHRSWSKKLATYSVVLTEVEYEKIADSRLDSYYELENGRLECPLYINQEDKEVCYYEDANFFEEDLSFVRKIMQNPDAQQQYYFLIVAQHGTGTDTICYTGVILNDVTKELIEFGVEYAKGAPIAEEKREWKDDVIATIVLVGCVIVLIYAMKAIDRKLDKKS